MIYKGKGGIEYNLETNPIASGGEGEIYNIIGQPTLVAKLYKPGKESTEKELKLVRMVDFPPNKNVLSQIAWPQDVLYSSGKFVGFVMSKMQINEDLNVVYEYGSSSKYPQMPWLNRIIIAKNLCAVLNSVHEVGHTCGDFNPKNISVNPNTGHIMFLDTDSYHIQDGSKTFRCDVGIPEYLPAEVQVKMRGGSTLATATLPTFSQDTDNFALAIHIFQLLMNGVHPFACAIIPSQSSVTAPQPSDNIIKGEFPFMQNISGVRIPVFAPKITILPQKMQDLFRRAFIDGHTNPSTRPTPEEWHLALSNLETELKTCNNVPYHEYYKALSSCPWCDVNNAFAQPFCPKAGIAQTTIKAPNTTPAPSVYAPSTSSTSNPLNIPASQSSSFFDQAKTKLMGLNKFVRIAIITVAIIIGFTLFKGMFSSNPSSVTANPNHTNNGAVSTTENSRPDNNTPSNSGNSTVTTGKNSVSKNFDGTYLSDLQWSNASNSAGGFEKFIAVKDNMGTEYSNGIGGKGTDTSWQEYRINKAYGKISGRVVLDYDARSQTNDDVYIWIYGDGIVQYMSPAIKAGVEPIDFSVNLSNINTLKVMIKGKKMLRLVDCIVYTSPDSKTFSSAQSTEQAINSRTYLSNLDWFNASNSKGGFENYNAVKDNLGNIYGNGIGGTDGQGTSWQEYRINSKYSNIQGKFVLNYDYRTKSSDDAYVKIYADGKLLYTSPLITAGFKPTDFSLNITGINMLKVSIHGKNMVRIVDCIIDK